MTLSQEPAISLCNLTTVFNRCILKESGSLPGSFLRDPPQAEESRKRDSIYASNEPKSELARDVGEYRDNGQNAQHFVPYSTRSLVEKSPPGGSHCGGMETGRLRDPPQAEESRKRDSIYTGKMRSILPRARSDPWSSIKHPLCGIMDSKIQQKEYLVLPAGDDCSDV